MRRRSLLKGIAASVFQIIFRPGLPPIAGSTRAVTHRVRPSDPLWPSPASWEKLKALVGGNLVQPQALFAACQTNPNDAACTEVLKNIRNPIYIGDQPAGLQRWRKPNFAHQLELRRGLARMHGE